MTGSPHPDGRGFPRTTPHGASASVTASVMRRRMGPPCAVLLLSGCLVVPPVPAPAPEVSGNAATLAAEVVARANEARVRHGARRLATSGSLTSAATDFARELAARGQLTHTSTRPGLADLMDRIDQTGLAVIRAGENLAALSARADMPSEVVRMWLGSEGHRRNLLNDGFTVTGAGGARGPGNVWYFVQVYATPASSGLDARAP